MSNVMALDVGDRRIGVAIASAEARIASPLLTIDRINMPDVLEYIRELMDVHNAKQLVVGLPRGLEGQETLQTKNVRDFAKELEQYTRHRIYLQDEAATSIAAEAELKTAGKPYQKGDIDKLAATIILSDWLSENEKI
jgi:putative Holliday junction resolvase